MHNNNHEQYQYLAPNPKSQYEQLFIKGTRTRAITIYNMAGGDEEALTPEEIAADSGLPLEAILEAIAYIESKPVEVELDFAAEEALMEATGMNDPNYDGRPKPLTPQEHGRIVQAAYESVYRRRYGENATGAPSAEGELRRADSA